MLANTALKSVQVEIEYQKYVQDLTTKGQGVKIGVLELGGEVKLGEAEIIDGKGEAREAGGEGS